MNLSHISETLGSDHSPEQLLGQWYFLRLSEPWDDDENVREYATRIAKITIIDVGKDKPKMLKGMQFILQVASDRQPLVDGSVVLEEYIDGDYWYGRIGTAPATPPSPVTSTVSSNHDFPDEDRLSSMSSSTGSSSSTSASAAGPRTLYAFWDVENCSVSADENMPALLARIDEIATNIMGYDWKPNSVFKYIYVDPHKKHNPQYRSLTPHLSVLDDNGWTMVNYSMKGNADVNMQQNVNAAIYQHMHDRVKPVVVMITGDSDFSPVLDHLRLAGWTNVVLLHTSARGSFISQAPHSFPWQEIRKGTAKVPIPRHIRDFAQAELENAGSDGILPSELVRRVQQRCNDNMLSFFEAMVYRFLDEETATFQKSDNRRCISPSPRVIFIERAVAFNYIQELWQPNPEKVQVQYLDGNGISITTVDFNYPEWQDEAAFEIEHIVRTIMPTLRSVPLNHWKREHIEAFRGLYARREWQSRYGIAIRAIEQKATLGLHLEVIGDGAELALRDFKQFVPTSKTVQAHRDRLAANGPFETTREMMLSDFGVAIYMEESGHSEMVNIHCFGFKGTAFTDGTVRLGMLVAKPRSVGTAYQFPQTHQWLYVMHNYKRFNTFFKQKFNVSLGCPSSEDMDAGHNMPLQLTGAAKDVERTIRYLEENVASPDVFMHHQLVLPDCISHKYKSFAKFIRNYWGDKLAYGHNGGGGKIDPLSVGGIPMALFTMDPHVPHGVSVKEFPFPMDVCIDVWIHKIHGRKAFENTVAALERLVETFCFKEFELPPIQFLGDIEPWLADPDNRQYFYDETNIDGVTWDKASCTVQLWAANEEIVNAAFDYLISYN